MSIQALRTKLLNTIDKVQSGEMKADDAKAISMLGQVIVNSAKAEIDYARFSGEKTNLFNQKDELLVNEVIENNNSNLLTKSIKDNDVDFDDKSSNYKNPLPIIEKNVELEKVITKTPTGQKIVEGNVTTHKMK